MKRDLNQAIKYTTKIINAWLPYKILYNRVPGLSVGIVYKGRLVYSQGFGYADIKSKRLATAKTCYRIASISKTFTAVAIMQLVEQKKIKLEDRVIKHLPWFKMNSSKINSNNITIQQLLSHRGGVWRDGDTPHWVDGRFPDIQKLKQSISANTLVFTSDQQFKYSNFGYAILGQIINQVSGLSYNDYVDKYIIKKLKLSQTAPDFSEKYKNCLAVGYARFIPGQNRAHYKHVQTKAYVAAAGWLSNVSDLARYLATWSLSDNTLLSKASKQQLIQKAQLTGEATTDKGYGLGLSVDTIRKRKIIGHGGGFAGFVTRIAFDPSNDLGVIVLSNVNDDQAPMIVDGIFDTIYRLVDEPKKYFVGHCLVGASIYEGVYRNRWDDTIIVNLGSNLVAISSQDKFPLKTADILRPQIKHQFLIDASSNFSATEESAVFVFKGKNKKPQLVKWGASPIRRLD